MTTLATDRLALRPLVEADLDAFAALVGDAAAMRLIGDGLPMARSRAAQTLERIVRQWAEQGYGWWGAWEGETLVGWVGFRAEPFDGVPEMGWLLRSSHWGRGLAGEAVAAVTAHAFGVLGFSAVCGLIRPENVASRRLAARLGFVHRGNVDVGGARQEVYVRERAL